MQSIILWVIIWCQGWIWYTFTLLFGKEGFKNNQKCWEFQNFPWCGYLRCTFLKTIILWCFAPMSAPSLEAVSDPDSLWRPVVCQDPGLGAGAHAGCSLLTPEYAECGHLSTFLLKQDPPPPWPQPGQTAVYSLVWLRSEGPEIPCLVSLGPQYLFDPSPWGYWPSAASLSFLSDSDIHSESLSFSNLLTRGVKMIQMLGTKSCLCLL